MKILHIASIRNSPFNGVCVAVPQHITHQQNEVEVALLNIEDCPINGIKHQFTYKKKNWREDVAADFKYPDLVIFHEVYHIEFVRIAKSLRKDKIPYVLVPHGSLARGAQKKKIVKKLIANALVFNSFIRHCSSIQCLSKNEYKNTNFNVSKFIGTNGIDIPQKQKVFSFEQTIHIIYIGRLEVYVKGLDLFIAGVKAALDVIKKSGKTIVIDMYGPDKMGRFSAVQSLIMANGLNGIISLHPAINGQEKIDKLLASDIFIQTSRHEGMPMGILEAMSYGIPCLITKGTSLGDIVTEYDAGWVAETSTESIAMTIGKAISEVGSLNVKSINARRLVSENFAWDIIMSDTIKNYNRIINNNLRR